MADQIASLEAVISADLTGFRAALVEVRESLGGFDAALIGTLAGSGGALVAFAAGTTGAVLALDAAIAVFAASSSARLAAFALTSSASLAITQSAFASVTQSVRALQAALAALPSQINIGVHLGVSAPGRAEGGPVSAGAAYIVGERGPELFVPSTSGAIVPNGRSAAAGGQAVNINGNVVLNGVQDVPGLLDALEREAARRNRRLTGDG